MQVPRLDSEESKRTPGTFTFVPYGVYTLVPLAPMPHSGLWIADMSWYLSSDGDSSLADDPEPAFLLLTKHEVTTGFTQTRTLFSVGARGSTGVVETTLLGVEQVEELSWRWTELHLQDHQGSLQSHETDDSFASFLAVNNRLNPAYRIYPSNISIDHIHELVPHPLPNGGVAVGVRMLSRLGKHRDDMIILILGKCSTLASGSLVFHRSHWARVVILRDSRHILHPLESREHLISILGSHGGHQCPEDHLTNTG